MSKALVYVMDMESSLSDALVRRVIDMGQYVIFRKWDMEVDPVAEVQAYSRELKAIIISGSARNINSKKKEPPKIPPELFQANVPILSICYGMQYLAYINGTKIIRCWDEPDAKKHSKAVAKKDKGEQGAVQFQRTNEDSVLFRGLGQSFPVWMKHNWMLEDIPLGWRHLGGTNKCPIGAIECGNIFSIQFHPEPYNSLFGRIILHNFLSYACGMETPYF